MVLSLICKKLIFCHINIRIFHGAECRIYAHRNVFRLMDAVVQQATNQLSTTKRPRWAPNISPFGHTIREYFMVIIFQKNATREPIIIAIAFRHAKNRTFHVLRTSGGSDGLFRREIVAALPAVTSLAWKQFRFQFF